MKNVRPGSPEKYGSVKGVTLVCQHGERCLHCHVSWLISHQVDLRFCINHPKGEINPAPYVSIVPAEHIIYQG